MSIRHDWVYEGAGFYRLTCRHCKGAFSTRRRDKLYCSANCRKAANRRAEVIDRRKQAAIQSINDIFEIWRNDKRLRPECEAALLYIARRAGSAGGMYDDGKALHQVIQDLKPGLVSESTE
ncbi:MAG TPA: hypothetical protein PLQ56_27705 [Aggregatilineales bacterium]|nr:hypothetical protein [Aggregatilineales bacterium]